MQVIKMVAKCTSYHVIAVACPDDVTEDDLRLNFRKFDSDLYNGHEDDCKIWDFDYTEDIEEDLETLEDCEEAADSWQGLADYTVEYEKYVQPKDYYPHSKRLVSQEVKQ